jgi:2-octaprenyl-6-methoxyphenol hydroxylase
MHRKTDIAIIGGGLVGLSAALALQNPGRLISVLESSTLLQREATGLNARSIALSYSSVQIFKALGLWQEIKKQSSPIKTIHISSRGRWGVTRLRASDYDLDAMGYVIESQKLTAILVERVRQSKLISLQTSAEFESLEISEQVKLQYRCDKKPRKLSASLVLIADGAQSSARSCLGIEHDRIDYEQAAIITNVEVSKPLPGAAYERFTDDGPLAMLPLGGSRYACVWTHNPASTEGLMQLDDRQFAESLQQGFGFRLGFIERVGQRYSFPLHRTKALELAKNRCLLIGNAANTLHPVAGQGLNLALRDVASLSHLLESQAVQTFDEQSIIRLLDEYDSLRTVEQRSVARLGDGLVSLYSNDLPVLKQIRAGALALLDIIPPVKTEVAMSGMGFGFTGNPMLRGRLR